MCHFTSAKCVCVCVYVQTHRLAVREIHLDQFVSTLLEVQTTGTINQSISEDQTVCMCVTVCVCLYVCNAESQSQSVSVFHPILQTCELCFNETMVTRLCTHSQTHTALNISPNLSDIEGAVNTCQNPERQMNH